MTEVELKVIKNLSERIDSLTEIVQTMIDTNHVTVASVSTTTRTLNNLIDVVNQHSEILEKFQELANESIVSEDEGYIH